MRNPSVGSIAYRPRLPTKKYAFWRWGPDVRQNIQRMPDFKLGFLKLSKTKLRRLKVIKEKVRFFWRWGPDVRQNF